MLLNCGVGEDPWSPLDGKEIKPVNPKVNQCWIFIGRTDAEAEVPLLWPPDVKSWLIGKDPHAEKDWGQLEKRETEDEIVGWHHWINGHEFQHTPGDMKDRETQRAEVYGVTKSPAWLSNWTATTTKHLETIRYWFKVSQRVCIFCIRKIEDLFLWPKLEIFSEKVTQRASIYHIRASCKILSFSHLTYLPFWPWSSHKAVGLIKMWVPVIQIHFHLKRQRHLWMGGTLRFGDTTAIPMMYSSRVTKKTSLSPTRYTHCLH